MRSVLNLATGGLIGTKKLSGINFLNALVKLLKLISTK